MRYDEPSPPANMARQDHTPAVAVKLVTPASLISTSN
jgi:hypothetical protein